MSLVTIGCKVEGHIKEAFKKIAQSNDKTPSSFLGDIVVTVVNAGSEAATDKIKSLKELWKSAAIHKKEVEDIIDSDFTANDIKLLKQRYMDMDATLTRFRDKCLELEKDYDALNAICLKHEDVARKKSEAFDGVLEDLMKYSRENKDLKEEVKSLKIRLKKERTSSN